MRVSSPESCFRASIPHSFQSLYAFISSATYQHGSQLQTASRQLRYSSSIHSKCPSSKSSLYLKLLGVTRKQTIFLTPSQHFLRNYQVPLIELFFPPRRHQFLAPKETFQCQPSTMDCTEEGCKDAQRIAPKKDVKIHNGLHLRRM